MIKKTFSLLLFYVGWYVCVCRHNLPAGLLGMSIALINILIMGYKFNEVYMIVCLALCGLLSDALAYQLEIYRFTYIDHFLDIANIWLFSLWLLFLTTFGALSFLRKYSVGILMLLGMSGGVFSYYLAYKLGAIYFPNHLTSLVYIGTNWLLIFPILFKLYNLQFK